MLMNIQGVLSGSKLILDYGQKSTASRFLTRYIPIKKP